MSKRSFESYRLNEPLAEWLHLSEYFCMYVCLFVSLTGVYVCKGAHVEGVCTAVCTGVYMSMCA